jgi:uncharacterized membrane protein HdeD (DUF308 family)
MTEAAVVAVVPEPARTPWWVVLLEGIALVVVGILLFTDTDRTVETLILFLGIWWFIGGIFDLVSLFMDRTHWGWKLFSGILGIIAGLAIIKHPLYASFLLPAVLVWMLGIFGIIIGGIALVRAFMGAGWGTGLLGVAGIVLGIIMLSANLGVAVASVIVAGAIWAIITGIAAIIFAFRLRSA